ncbi:MAG: cyanophycinase [Thermaerobacter sp.]|nr:cyanophycinase [Thermaerobacter sp.]
MGPLLLIGGHEEPQGAALEAFAANAGQGGRIALLTAATQDPQGAYRRYREIFTRLGLGEVVHIGVEDRSDCAQREAAQAVRDADGIFFTGGDQLRITSLVGGTPVEAAIHAARGHGAVIGGTSAGASAMTDTMLVGGQDEEAARRASVRMCPGLGFLRAAVVDQHFAQRGRINRLIAALAQNPGILGIGIDENTAILVRDEERLEVLGAGTVTILDGRGADLVEASEHDIDKPVALGSVALWLLRQGYGFDLRLRAPVHSSASAGKTSAVPVLR